METWSWGDPQEPKTDDPRFETQQKAIDAAIAASYADGDPILAVWREDDGELTNLVFAGWVYSA